jgi:major membrane immunogen (membrane-anchored lipoprotein)
MIGRSGIAYSISTLLVAASLFGACGGDDGNEGAPAAMATAGTSEHDRGAASDDAFREAAEKFADASFKVEFEVTNAGAAGVSDFTMYKNGRDRLRVDITTSASGETIAAIIIATPEGARFCLENAGVLAPAIGVGAGDGVCSANDPTQGPLRDLTNIEGDIAAYRGQPDLDVTREEIAGEEAFCVSRTGVAGAVSDVCLSSEGVPLRLSTAGFGVEATDVGTVTDGDFTPPYPERAFPGQ